MSKKKRNRQIGAVPGTVTYTGDIRLEASIVTYIAYSTDTYIIREFDKNKPARIEEPDSSLVQWYDVRGVHDVALIEKLGASYNIHQLAQEDIVDITQRPKYAEFAEGIFLSIKSLTFDKNSLELTPETISIFFGDQYLISFQEDVNDTLCEIYNRIRDGRGRVRLKGSDYLAFAITDYVVDQYYEAMDDIEDLISELETQLLSASGKIQKNRILTLKMLLIEMRKQIIPMREAIHQFGRAESNFIDVGTSKYIKDTLDHILQINDMVESNKDTLSGLQDLYNSEISSKTNQIIQFLTVMTSIFVPITFLAGVYGMNFEYFPELKHPYGYFILWGVMIAIVAGMLYFFKRRGWL